MPSKATVKLPDKLVDLFTGEARYRVAYGGRGSGKTRSFAKMTAVRAYMLAAEGKSGSILCGREFQNSLDESSMSEVKAAILSEPWLAEAFEIGEKYIRTQGLPGQIEYAFIGLSRNLDSVKSRSHIHLAWLDEAEHISESAYIKLIPTVREANSELWISYNPESKRSATHRRFRENTPERCKIVEINWRDNPWFPEVLEYERQNDKKNRPEQYRHIWEGDFVTVQEGSYYAKHLIEADEEGRICNVAADPHLRKRCYWDLGGRGAKSDATAIIVAQFVGREIRVLDYYEAVGQPLSSHIGWLRKKGLDDALMVLPHDGEPKSPIADASWQTSLQDAGFDVEIVPNQGAGAAKQRIEASRKLFNSIWFNKGPTEPLREALGWYHEKIDEERRIGLGPNHDWSSHAADAFGMMCQAYDPPRKIKPMPEIATDWVV